MHLTLLTHRSLGRRHNASETSPHAVSNVMMKGKDFRISHTSAEGILRIRLEGKVTLDRAVKYAARYREIVVQHPCILWDLLDFDLGVVTSGEVIQLPESFKDISKLRAGGRTAILVPRDLDLIAKSAVAQFEMHGVPVEFASFLSEEDALAWLRAI